MDSSGLLYLIRIKFFINSIGIFLKKLNGQGKIFIIFNLHYIEIINFRQLSENYCPT